VGCEAPVSSAGGVSAERSMHVVADFLSDPWIAALANACDAAREADAADGDGDGAGAGEPLVIEPAVRDVPGLGEVRYHVSFDGGSCSVEAVRADSRPADVRLETDYPTAAALARGELNAQTALAEGRLRVVGDVARLAAHAAALARFDDLFASVRATTSYPDA
jgi:SCP-2 sterol transfer family